MGFFVGEGLGAKTVDTLLTVEVDTLETSALKSRHSSPLIFECRQAKDYSGRLVKNRKGWS